MFCTPFGMLGTLLCCDLPEQHDLTGAATGTGAGEGRCLGLVLQQLPPWTGAGAVFGLQQLDVSSLCVGSMRGVELALEGGEASLLPLRSVGVLYDDVSVSFSWLALIAFSNEPGWTAVDLRLGFEIRLLPATVADCARSEGQAHSEVLGMV